MRSNTPPTVAAERREERAGEERELVAAVERLEGAVAGRAQRVRARGREARQDGEAERAAHHERRVDDARREARLLRLDVAHRGEQHRVERDAGADAEQDHPRQHVDDEVAVDRRAGEEHEPDRREPRGPPTSGARMPKRITSFAETPEREHAHDQVRRAGTRGRPGAGCSRARAAGRAPRGRTTRTSPPPTARRRRWRSRGCAAGRAASGTSGALDARLDPQEDRQEHRRDGEQAERLRRTSSRPRCR